jgi:esterase
MKLEFKKFGNGFPLVILHGLYGSGDNWFTIGRNLSSYFTVYLPDLRNHGTSPHSDDHNYDLLTDDLEEFFVDQQITNACLIGHSMGGKTALNFAFKNPDKVAKLVVVDIAIRSYSIEGEFAPQAIMHRRIIDLLLAIDIQHTTSRSEIDKNLSTKIPQKSIRQYLLKNLKRKEDGEFYWGLNLHSLDMNIQRILDAIDCQNITFIKPVLIISGKNSGYITKDDLTDFKDVFPNMIFHELDSGHWVHVEQPEKFLEILRDFLIEKSMIGR